MTDFGAGSGVDSYAGAFDDTIFESWANVGPVDVPAYAPIRLVAHKVDVYSLPSKNERPHWRPFFATQVDDVFSPWYAINGPLAVPKSPIGGGGPGDPVDPVDLDAMSGLFSMELYTPILLNTNGQSFSPGQSFGVVPGSFDMSSDRHGFIYLGDPEIEDLEDVRLCIQVAQNYTLGKMVEYDTGADDDRKVEAYGLNEASLGQFGRHKYQVPWVHYKGTAQMSASDFGSEGFYLWHGSYHPDYEATGGSDLFRVNARQQCHHIGGSCN